MIGVVWVLTVAISCAANNLSACSTQSIEFPKKSDCVMARDSVQKLHRGRGDMIYCSQEISGLTLSDVSLCALPKAFAESLHVIACKENP